MLFELAPFALPEEYGDGIVPLADAKAQLRVAHDDEDDLIGLLRDAAVDMVEKYCSVRLAVCTGLVWRAECLPQRLSLGVGPALEVTGFKWLDSDGVEQTGDVGALRIGLSNTVVPVPGESWPSGIAAGIELNFTAGYAETERPPALIQAVKLFLGHLYVNREAAVTGTISTEIPLGFTALCDRYRIAVL